MRVVQASDAYHVFTSGQAKIQQGLLREGYELISEALNLLNNVYGAMHPEIAACNRLLARLNYIMGDYTEVSAHPMSDYIEVNSNENRYNASTTRTVCAL